MLNNFFNTLCFFVFVVFTNCQSTDPPIPRIYRYESTINIEGTFRSYLLNLPSKYYDKDSSRFPLVIALHGTAGKAIQMERDYGLTEKANASDFIVVYPEGVRNNGPLGVRTWNAGSCCDYAKDNNINDVGFISTLIDWLIDNYRIDSKRILWK